jgi:hypothetical protein
VKRTILRGGVLAAIALSMVTVRVLWSSRVEWRAAEAALATGEVPLAVDHFGRAARLHAPGNPWCRRSLDRLDELARRAEAAGDVAAALSAWRELRSSVLATRGAWTPHQERLAPVDARIAELSARSESPSLDPTSDLAARTRWHAARLAQDDAPSVGWTLLALAGLCGWIGAAVGFLFRALDDDDRLRARAALGWGGGVALGLALFLVGLARA